MGQDKALLRVGGRTLVEIAVEKLREFCGEVSIAGNREDLREFAPVVREQRVDAGPAAGVEAGLKACRQPWAMFVPVDVPLVPVEMLRRWVLEAMRAPMSVSYLGASFPEAYWKQPAFCLLETERQRTFSRLLDDGERGLEELLNRTAWADNRVAFMYDEFELYPKDQRPDEATQERWFTNVNTPEDLARVDALLSLEGVRA
jgi:molybdopterin-guanine dinucleotide biosynthesis protein A